MKEKLVSNGVLLGIGINIVLLVCMYFLEKRVEKLEVIHHEEQCYYHD